MARPARFSDAQIAQLILEYDKTPPGEKKDMAERLGLRLSSLMVYISRWRYRHLNPVALSGDSPDNDSWPF